MSHDECDRLGLRWGYFRLRCVNACLKRTHRFDSVTKKCVVKDISRKWLAAAIAKAKGQVVRVKNKKAEDLPPKETLSHMGGVGNAETKTEEEYCLEKDFELFEMKNGECVYKETAEDEL